MKISAISVNTFTAKKHSKKENSKQNTISSISYNNNGWLYSSYLKPSVKNYPKEIKYEFYSTIRDEDGNKKYIPIDGTVITECGKKKLIQGLNYKNFTGAEFTKTNGEITRETFYLRGYPLDIIEYRNGEKYKLSHLSQNTHKINQVYYFDGSFELSQKTGPQDAYTVTELQTLNKYGEKSNIIMQSTQNPKYNGFCTCKSFIDDDYRTITLNWNYPDRNHFISENEQYAHILKDKLIELRETINKDEYKDDFAQNKIVNKQLNQAIEYLLGTAIQ